MEGVDILQGVVQQQEDLIRVIEDQLDRLRKLLLLREQFIALIADITTFITRYTEVIKDIETGGHSTQEKIKKYDDVRSMCELVFESNVVEVLVSNVSLILMLSLHNNGVMI